MTESVIQNVQESDPRPLAHIMERFVLFASATVSYWVICSFVVQLDSMEGKMELILDQRCCFSCRVIGPVNSTHSPPKNDSTKEF